MQMCRMKNQDCLAPAMKTTAYIQTQPNDAIQPCIRPAAAVVQPLPVKLPSPPPPAPVFPPPPPPSQIRAAEAVSYLPGGLQGVATTYRFWDCAKPSCAWNKKALVTRPAASCAIDGTTLMDPSSGSGSQPGGTAFACNDQQPFVSSLDPNLSFGFAAFASLNGESRSCCTCFEIKFLAPRLAGKRMILQTINVNNGDGLTAQQFIEMQVPGGGIGGVNACFKQWNAGPEWGDLYGGLRAEVRVSCAAMSCSY